MIFVGLSVEMAILPNFHDFLCSIDFCLSRSKAIDLILHILFKGSIGICQFFTAFSEFLANLGPRITKIIFLAIGPSAQSLVISIPRTV